MPVVACSACLFRFREHIGATIYMFSIGMLHVFHICYIIYYSTERSDFSTYFPYRRIYYIQWGEGEEEPSPSQLSLQEPGAGAIQEWNPGMEFEVFSMSIFQFQVLFSSSFSFSLPGSCCLHVQCRVSESVCVVFVFLFLIFVLPLFYVVAAPGSAAQRTSPTVTPCQLSGYAVMQTCLGFFLYRVVEIICFCFLVYTMRRERFEPKFLGTPTRQPPPHCPLPHAHLPTTAMPAHRPCERIRSSRFEREVRHLLFCPPACLRPSSFSFRLGQETGRRGRFFLPCLPLMPCP